MSTSGGLDSYKKSFQKWFKVFNRLPEILMILIIVSSIVVGGITGLFWIILIGITVALIVWFFSNAIISPQVLQTISLDNIEQLLASNDKKQITGISECADLTTSFGTQAVSGQTQLGYQAKETTEHIKDEATVTAELKDNVKGEKTETFCQKLEYALQFTTEDGMVRWLQKNIQSLNEADRQIIQEIISKPIDTVREEIEKVLQERRR